MNKPATMPETVRLVRHEIQNGCVSLLSVRELPDVLARIVRLMRREGHGPVDILAVGLALEEAVASAVAHGRGRSARVWWGVTTMTVKLVVEEESTPTQQPCLRDRLERSSSGGLTTLQACMSWINFSRRGNCLAMCRNRSQARP